MRDRTKARGVVARELDVGATERAVACHRIGPGGFGAGVHRRDAQAKSLLRQLTQERALVGEVGARRRVGDAEIAREGAQTQRLDPALRNHLGRPLEQGLSQIPVVVRHSSPQSFRCQDSRRSQILSMASLSCLEHARGHGMTGAPLPTRAHINSHLRNLPPGTTAGQVSSHQTSLISGAYAIRSRVRFSPPPPLLNQNR